VSLGVLLGCAQIYEKPKDKDVLKYYSEQELKNFAENVATGGGLLRKIAVDNNTVYIADQFPASGMASSHAYIFVWKTNKYECIKELPTIVGYRSYSAKNGRLHISEEVQGNESEYDVDI